MRLALLGMLLLPFFLASPPEAKVTNGGSPELFLRCSELHRRAAALKTELRDMERQAKPGMAKDRRLAREVRKHEKEARRLEKIADIMRNSDEVQNKYRRAVRRYKRASSRHREYRKFVDRMARLYDRRRDAQKAVNRRANTECQGNWKTAILQRFCTTGKSDHTAFCAKFSKFKPALAKAPAKKKRRSAPAYAGGPRVKFKSWTYLGIRNYGTRNATYVAQTQVSDDTLQIHFSPYKRTVSLLFTYKGSTAFSQAKRNQAEIFMRTRKEARLRGRYGSDYVFSGKTLARPNANPSAPQYVAATLTHKDLDALRKLEKNEIIGVGYYIADGSWKTYTLPASGVWAAYRHIRAKAAAN